MLAVAVILGFYGVMVSTLDFESSDRVQISVEP